MDRGSRELELPADVRRAVAVGVRRAPGGCLARRVRRRGAPRADRGTWAPRWFWPSFAAPATLFLLLFFVFPFYVVSRDVRRRRPRSSVQPVPAWNPATWDPAILAFTLSNITHTDGLYHTAFLRHVRRTSGSRRVAVPGDRLPVRVLPRAPRRPVARAVPRVCSSRPSGSPTCCGCWRGSRLLQDDGLINRILMRFGVAARSVPLARRQADHADHRARLRLRAVHGAAVVRHAGPDPSLAARGGP